MAKTLLSASLLASAALSQSIAFDYVSEFGGAYAISPVATDVDGDGDLDVLVASYLGITWHENFDGNFLPYPLTLGEHLVSTAVSSPRSIRVADIDGDGDDDVLSASFGDNKIAWYPNLGGGNYGAQRIVSANVVGASDVIAADVDGDGDLDVCSAAQTAGEVAFYINDGAGNFSAALVMSAASAGVSSLHAADVDGDGDMDILSASGAVAWHENFGFGFFGSPAVIVGSSGAGFVTTADLDGDGDADLVWSAPGGQTLAYQFNDGLGGFGPAIVIPPLLGSYQAGVPVDLDNDGDIDILHSSAGGPSAWHENLGAGQFSAAHYIGWGHGNTPLAADLSGDGYPDVLIADSTIKWWKSVPPPPPPVTSTAQVLGVGCGSPTMAFLPTSTAVVGATMEATVSNTPTPVCVVAMGLSASLDPGGAALPFDMSVIGMVGCTLYQSAEVFGLGTQLTGVPFEMAWSYPVPGSSAVVGVHIYTQAFSYAPGVNSMGFIASNAIDWMLGDQ